MKKFFALLIVVLSLVGYYYYNQSQKEITEQNQVLDSIETVEERTIPLDEYEKASIAISNTEYDVFVADTPENRSQGLSYVPGLRNKEGMLFIFEESDKHGFWMKGMQFALDFVYIQDDKVVDTLENITPETYPEIHVPSAAANIVLEINAGEIEENSIQIGDPVDLDNVIIDSSN